MKFQEAKAAAVKMLSSPEFKQRVIEEDETMLKHFDIIKKINSSGFLTIESQAGNKKTGTNPDTKKRYEIIERAYISGFMLESEAADFIKNMGIHTDKNAVYIAGCADDVYLPSALDTPLTIQKSGRKWEVATHGTMTLPNYVWEMYRKQLHINKSEKIVHIFCWDSKWVRNASGPAGLFTDVLKILKMK